MPLTRAAPWTADYITALFCLWSSLAGYIHAQRTGEGQSIGNRATAFQPYDTFQAKDGWVVITAVGNVYQRVLPVIGLIGLQPSAKIVCEAGLQTSAILQTSTTASLRRRGRTFMGLDEVRLRGRGHEPGDRRPISFMLPRRFLGRPARRLFRGRLLRVGIPTAYDDGAASRADARYTPYYSRDIQLMRRDDAAAAASSRPVVAECESELRSYLLAEDPNRFFDAFVRRAARMAHAQDQVVGLHFPLPHLQLRETIFGRSHD